jgi:hypothetical protein
MQVLNTDFAGAPLRVLCRDDPRNTRNADTEPAARCRRAVEPLALSSAEIPPCVIRFYKS